MTLLNALSKRPRPEYLYNGIANI